MYDVVLFAPLGWERRALQVGLREVRPAAGTRRWSGRLGTGAACLLVQAGVGFGRAATIAAGVPPAGLFVTCGCAGALAPTLRTGEVVAADAVVSVDADLGTTVRLPASAETTAALALARGFPLHVGPVVSSPRLLASRGDKERAARTGGLVVDMESAPIAAEAQRRGVPNVVLRVVLDLATQALDLPSGGVDVESGETRLGPALTAFAPPWRWLDAARLARQHALTARALRRLASVVLAEAGSAAFPSAPQPRSPGPE
jgi:nucleoside phosphorylase